MRRWWKGIKTTTKRPDQTKMNTSRDEHEAGTADYARFGEAVECGASETALCR